MREKKNRKDYQQFTKSLSSQLDTNGATRETYPFKWHLWSQSLPCATMLRDCKCFPWNSLLPYSEKWLGLPYFDLKITFHCISILKKLSSTSLWGGERKTGQFITPKKEIWPSHYINSKAFHSKVVYLNINKTVIIRTISVSLQYE